MDFLRGLLGIGKEKPDPELIEEIERLNIRLNGYDVTASRAAANKLGWTKHPLAAQYLHQAFIPTRHETVLVEIVNAMEHFSESGNPDAVKVLAKALMEENGAIRYQALRVAHGFPDAALKRGKEFLTALAQTRPPHAEAHEIHRELKGRLGIPH